MLVETIDTLRTAQAKIACRLGRMDCEECPLTMKAAKACMKAQIGKRRLEICMGMESSCPVTGKSRIANLVDGMLHPKGTVLSRQQ